MHGLYNLVPYNIDPIKLMHNNMQLQCMVSTIKAKHYESS